MNESRTPHAIDVVIVNYRTGPLVVSCLETLAAEIGEDLEIRAFVVDNASQDGSAEIIEAAVRRAEWDWVRVIRSPVNGGFGAGNNIGIDIALGQERTGELAGERAAELVWLLNPDTRVMPGAARALVRFLPEVPSAGVIGTALLEGDGTPWPFAFRFPSILGEIERGLSWRLASRLLSRHAVARRMNAEPARADWVSGASLAIRSDLLRQGLRFDEGYFLYYEETDLCRMVQAMGRECWYLPQACVLHIAGQSTGVTDSRAGPRRLPGYWFESRRRYFRKNHGPVYALAADLAWMASYAVFLMKQAFRRSSHAEPPRLFRDFIAHSSLLPRRP